MISEVYSLRASQDEKQEVALRLWKRIKTGKASANHKAEALAILHNMRVDEMRRKKVLKKNLLLVQPLLKSEWNDEPLLYDESAFPEPIRKVISLLKYGYTVNEISKLLGISERSVYHRIEQAKAL